MKRNYKIVQILNEYSVVINGGFNDGIKRGQLFQIYNIGDEVFDPDTKLSLGTRDNIKAEVIATEVSEKLTVCENRTNTSLINKYLWDEHTTFAQTIDALSKRIPTPLPIDPSQVTESTKYDKTIHIGDLVRPISYDK